MHIKYNHSIKGLFFIRTALLFQAPIHIFFAYMYDTGLKKIKKRSLKKFLNSSLSRGAAHSILFLCTFIAPLIAFRWYQELQATREGAKAMLTPQDARILLAELLPTNVNAPSETLLQNLVYHFYHPPDSWHDYQIAKAL